MLLNKCIGDLSLRVKGTGSRVNESERELADLVPRAAGGDRAAMQRIMVIIHPIVLRYARARIGGGRHPTAEDVAQEICLAVAMSVGNYVVRFWPLCTALHRIK